MRIIVLLFLIFLSFDKETVVKADSATFNGATIILQGKVRVENADYQIQSEKAMLYKDEEKLSALAFPWIELREEVKAVFQNTYFLECETIDIDYLKKNLLFGSEKRIFFHDASRKLFADKAFVEYTEQEKENFEVSKIILLGNVEMASLDEGMEQFALADRVEFFPKEHIVFLEGEEGKRVLFIDKQKDITISAEKVRAEKKKGGKELIEGIGDVRFVFKEEELDKLKSRFSFQ